jgi:hypothetical protein
MWPIYTIKNFIETRREEARRLMSSLEERLKKEDIILDTLDFTNEDNLNYLAFGLLGYNQRVDLEFCRLAKKYEERKNDSGLQFEFLTYDESKQIGHECAYVGDMHNPNYEKELQQYNRDIQKREEILATEEGKVYTYVLHETDGSQDWVCDSCCGSGYSYSSIGLGDPLCSACGGESRRYHEPNISPEQKIIFDKLDESLRKLNSPEPRETFWAYARIR